MKPSTQRSWSGKFDSSWTRGRAGQSRAEQGRAGSRSRMALGSCRVSHIHTLWVETGHERVLQVAWMSQELLGSRTGWRFCSLKGGKRETVSGVADLWVKS